MTHQVTNPILYPHILAGGNTLYSVAVNGGLPMTITADSEQDARRKICKWSKAMAVKTINRVEVNEVK